MTSATRPSASPSRRATAAFPGKMPRGASPSRSRPLPVGAALLAASLAIPALALPGAAAAQDAKGSHSPRGACLQAARGAERAHGLPEGLLVAVALAESGLHAYALSIAGRSHFPADAESARRLIATARKGSSIMAGCVQVNARVHAPSSDWPLDPARATDWAARNLRRQFDRTGDWGEAIRAWNGGAPRTASHLVCRVRAKMQATSPGSAALSGDGCAEGETARELRNARALLEIAEAR